MADPAPPPRRGSIDAAGPLESIDLVALAGGEDGWPAGYLSLGFNAPAKAMRRVVDRWAFIGLGRVADVGCGFGRWSPFLAEVNAEVVGYDRNRRGIDLGRRIAELFDLANLSFEAADVTALPAAPGAFDAAWCCNVAQFIDRGRLLREINRILRPGGRLAILKYIAAGGLLENFYKDYARGGLDHHNVRFTLDCLKNGPRQDGAASYGDEAVLGSVLRDHGFELESAPAPLFRARRREPRPAIDLAALAARLERDAAFRADFVLRPAFALAFPLSIDLVAVKRRDLAPER